MSTRIARLHVRSGLHRGARTGLPGGRQLTLGCDDACDIRLLDAGVAARHVELRARRCRLRVHALQGGVQVRGRELRPGTRASVRGGESFRVASIRLRYENPHAARNRIWTALRRTPHPARQAQHAGLLATAAVGSVVIALWPAAAPQGQAEIDPKAWPGVSRVFDARNGLVRYTGHVADDATLARLRAQLQRHGGLGDRFGVAARERIGTQLEELVSHHYALSRVVELGPGRYRVVTAGPAVFLDAIAWDTALLAHQAREQIRGLDAIEFTEDPRLLDAGTALPLSAPSWSLVSTPRGQWISDASPRRHFEGAHLPEGRLLDLDRCVVRIVDAEHGRVLHFRADPAHVPCP